MKDILSSIDEIVPKKTVASDMLKQLAKQANESIYPARERFGIHPSSLHTITVAEAVMQYWQPSPTQGFGLESELFMGMGTAIHKIIQKHLYNAGYLVGSLENDEYVEPKFECELMQMRGYVDGVVRVPNVQVKKGLCPILDIKSTGSRNYASIKSAAQIPDKYKMQAEIYLKFFGSRVAWFMYVCRDSGRKKIIPYDYVGSYWDAAYKKACDILEHIRDRKFPKGEKVIPKEEFSNFIDECISSQPNRKFLDLSNWSRPDDAAMDRSTLFYSYPV